jgi:hypothetical protein
MLPQSGLSKQRADDRARNDQARAASPLNSDLRGVALRSFISFHTYILDILREPTVHKSNTRVAKKWIASVQRRAFIKKASGACGVQARRRIEEFGQGDGILRLPEHGKTMGGDGQNRTDKRSKNFRVIDRARPAAPRIHQESIRGMWRTSQKKN